jgi:hypothetical protein
MKYLSKSRIYIAMFLALTFSACDNGFEQLNVDPVNPTNVPAENILPAATVSSVSRLMGANMNMTYAALWAQQIAKIQYIDEDRYAFRPDAMDAHWNGLYAGPLMDLQIVIDKAGESGDKNMEAAGRIMKAYVFQNVTDLWGDVPYSEALKGGSENNFTPKYDAQSAIYADLLKELKVANDLLADGGAVKGDLIYGGNAMAWRKFANSLRLRLLTRMSGVDAATAKAGIEEIFADQGRYPVFAGNEDDAELTYLASQPYRNPIFENSVTRDDHGISKTMMDLLKANDDPRLTIYAKPNNTGAYVGQPNGALSQPNIATISRIGEKFRDAATAPLYIITYSEVMFARAEAAARGWSVGMDAKEAYEAGVRASMEKHGATGVDAYLLKPGVNFELATNKFKVIGEQKWLALFMQGIEAFSEVRRTGFPNTLVEPEGSAFPGKGLPLRFPYPTIEQSLNPANVSAASAGIDQFLFGKRMWWDVN